MQLNSSLLNIAWLNYQWWNSISLVTSYIITLIKVKFKARNVDTHKNNYESEAKLSYKGNILAYATTTCFTLVTNSTILLEPLIEYHDKT